MNTSRPLLLHTGKFSQWRNPPCKHLYLFKWSKLGRLPPTVCTLTCIPLLFIRICTNGLSTSGWWCNHHVPHTFFWHKHVEQYNVRGFCHVDNLAVQTGIKLATTPFNLGTFPPSSSNSLGSSRTPCSLHFVWPCNAFQWSSHAVTTS